MTASPPSRLLALLLLTSCTNSVVETGETWTQPTQAQVAAFRGALPATVNPYVRKSRSPTADRNGCATSVRKEQGALLITSMHPRELYCIGLAPYHTTLLELPPGVRLVNATASSPFVQVVTASTNERDVLMLTSNCVPVRKDEAGNFVKPPLADQVEEQTLGTCPIPTSDFTLVTSVGVSQFQLLLNNSTHTSQVIMEEAEPDPQLVRVPARPRYAQDLIIVADSEEEVPWWPDEAWVDGTKTVVVWHRPMPTLPQVRMGPEGEQTAAMPRVVNLHSAVALIFDQRVDIFQLRMDDRILSFSLEKPRPFIQPAES